MILVIMRMTALSEKCLELAQTMASLSGSIRLETGCRRCEVCQDIVDRNRFFILEEWDTQEHLMAHLKSEHYRVFRGATTLLKEPYKRTLHTVFHPMGLGKI